MLKDVAALVGRIGVGVVFFAHGLQKLTEFGIAGTAQAFGGMGVPMPTVSAWYSTIVELVGGAALILGVGLPVVGLLLAVDMIGALLFVHLPNGLIGPNGYELVLALAVASIALGFNGGAFALDRVLRSRRVRQPA
ncbi:DoxX family protein [Actinosynnema sp. NPDC020468]|uniref:DoxX family protein n=1 Tax=Actinosynnema sp. NPDC020468 TaxID=3154488 RepID=UPI0033DDD290